MRSFKSGILALITLAASGCAWSASPADGLRFQAPAGWRSSPGIMGFMQFWRPPGDDQEVLMLFKSPKPLQPRDVFSTTELQDTLKHATIERRQTIEICGAQPATYVEARGVREPWRRSHRDGDDDHRWEELFRNVPPSTRGRAELDGSSGTTRALRETLTAWRVPMP